MKYHIRAPGGTLCNNGSVAAWTVTTDCKRCCNRMEEILDLLLDMAEGKPGAIRRAKRVVAKLGIVRDDQEKENDLRRPAL